MQLPAAERVQVAGEGSVTVPVPPEAIAKVTVVPATLPVVPVTVAVHTMLAAIATGDGAQLTLVVDAARTVTEPVPELTALAESPGYAAFREAVPPVAPVTVMLQVVPERLQVAGEGRVTVPEPPWVNVIVSPVTVPLKPATVAVQVDFAPTATAAGAHATLVVVAANGMV